MDSKFNWGVEYKYYIWNTQTRIEFYFLYYIYEIINLKPLKYLSKNLVFEEVYSIKSG